MDRNARGVFRPIAAAGLCMLAVVLFAQSGAESGPAAVEGEKLSVAEARRSARFLHKTYETTLATIHRRYFDIDEKQMIPARALEEVFREVDAETGRETRWISVNTPAMNVDHEPREGFEADAAAALASGKEEFERVENGIYQRAGAITLGGSCLKCHVSGLTKQISTKKVAGFVVSIPVESK